MTTRPTAGHPAFEEGARQILTRGWYPDAWGRVRVCVHRDTSRSPYRIIVTGDAGQSATYDRSSDTSAEATAISIRAMFTTDGRVLRSERAPIRPKETRLR